MISIGLLSDTHDEFDPRILDAFAEVDAVIHAGDVTNGRVFRLLSGLGVPLHVVRGNCDRLRVDGEPLPTRLDLDIFGIRLVAAHKREHVGPVACEEVDVVVFGHTHAAYLESIDGVLWVNPGSPTEPRVSPLGRSVAIVDIAPEGTLSARHVDLEEIGPD